MFKKKGKTEMLLGEIRTAVQQWEYFEWKLIILTSL